MPFPAAGEEHKVTMATQLAYPANYPPTQQTCRLAARDYWLAESRLNTCVGSAADAAAAAAVSCRFKLASSSSHHHFS
jgi:hypothetical protein